VNDREVLNGCLGNSDVWNSICGRRQRWEKRERKMANRVTKLRTMGPIPGIDGIEPFELGDASPFHHSHQIQAGVGDSPGAVGKTDQRKHRARRPDFGVTRACSLERGQRKDNVANRARPNEKSTTGDKIACPTAING